MTEPGARASRVQEGCRSSQRFHPQPLLPPPAAARSPWPPRVAGPAKRKRTASLGRDFTSRVLCGAFLATLVRLSSSDLSACCTSDNKQALGRHNVCVCVRSKNFRPLFTFACAQPGAKAQDATGCIQATNFCKSCEQLETSSASRC